MQHFSSTASGSLAKTRPAELGVRICTALVMTFAASLVLVAADVGLGLTQAPDDFLRLVVW